MPSTCPADRPSDATRPLSERLLAATPPAIALCTLAGGLLAYSNGALDGAVPLLVTGWVVLTPLAATLFWEAVPLPALDHRLRSRLPDARLGSSRTPSADRWGNGRRGSDASRTGRTSDGDDALATLRARYARGEIDEREFERRLDDLLATEDASVRTSGGRSGVGGGVPIRSTDRSTGGRSGENERANGQARDSDGDGDRAQDRE